MNALNLKSEKNLNRIQCKWLVQAGTENRGRKEKGKGGKWG
jgi:hypothetical protein